MKKLPKKNLQEGKIKDLLKTFDIFQEVSLRNSRRFTKKNRKKKDSNSTYQQQSINNRFHNNFDKKLEIFHK
jgi:hypothetical protein